MPVPLNDPIFREETDSTNREMWRMVESSPDLPEGTALWTNNQFAGRGMAGTTWTSETGKNLTCSFLLKPSFLEPGKQFLLNKCIALSICTTLKQIAPKYDFGIKWPNDIYHKNRKIAGTLIENRILGKTYELCVAGIGININQLVFPKEIPNAVSLAFVTGQEHSVKRCLEVLSGQLGYFYSELKAGNIQKIDCLYLKHLLGYGENITFRQEDKIFTAIIAGISEHGKLILNHNNAILEFGMKEIEFVL